MAQHHLKIINVILKKNGTGNERVGFLSVSLLVNLVPFLTIGKSLNDDSLSPSLALCLVMSTLLYLQKFQSFLRKISALKACHMVGLAGPGW